MTQLKSRFTLLACLAAVLPGCMPESKASRVVVSTSRTGTFAAGDLLGASFVRTEDAKVASTSPRRPAPIAQAPTPQPNTSRPAPKPVATTARPATKVAAQPAKPAPLAPTAKPAPRQASTGEITLPPYPKYQARPKASRVTSADYIGPSAD